MTARVILGDCAETLRTLPDGTFQCCVTSPPYYGLRDYGHAGQIGLEDTPDAYVARLVDVFREVRRVLRDDGTLWLNLGDSYNNFRTQMGPGQAPHARDDLRSKPAPGSRARGWGGAKEKDLLGIPWMVAFALRADGWFLRSDIIWHKPNPMPESVRDRPTSAHEHVFLLSKRGTYFYDADAISEDACGTDERPQQRRAREIAETAGLTDAHIAAVRACGVADAGKAQVTQSGFGKNTPEVMRLAAEAKAALGGYLREFLMAPRRNARNVWTIATQPYSGAHFATMPPDLAERCIKAGSKPGDHVLDSFGGAGTTALVADRLGRHATICELNPEYASLARERITADAPLLAAMQAAE